MRNFTATSVKAISPSTVRQQLADLSTPGLFLIVQPSGIKSWAWRGRIAGTPRKLTLGRYPAHGLADARDWARDLTRKRDGGIDPIREREQQAKSDADAALTRLTARGLHTARVVQERGESTAYQLKLPAVGAALKPKLAELGALLAGKPLHPCNG